jgi:hypothetical protein
MRRSSLWLVPFAVAMGVAAATSVCFPFDGLYGQDAFAYFRYARALWPHVLGGAPLPDLYWPIGYPATVALLLPLAGGGPAAGQIVNAVSCGWAAAATALLVQGLQRLVHRYSTRRLAGPPIRRFWPWAMAAVLVGFAALAPVLVVAHSVPPSLERHEWLLAWSLRNAIAREFHTPDGYAIYRLPIALFYFVRMGWPDYFFPALALFALAGAWSLVRQRRWATSVLLLGWPAVAWLFLSGIPYENPRFLLPTLPAIGTLWGIGLASLRRRVSARGRALLTLFVVASQTAGVALGAREHARLVAVKNADRDLVAWTAARLRPEDKLLIEGPSLAFQYYAAIPARDLFSAGAAEIDALVASRAPLFLLADVKELEIRWPGRAPSRHFRALSQNPGLAIVGVHAPYTLFRVGPRADGERE